MKKILVLLGTIASAFLFVFAFGITKAYAEEDAGEDPVATETAEVEVTSDESTTTYIAETGTDPIVVDTDDKTLDDILGIELSEEQVNAIASVIGKYTNEEVEKLSLTLYAEIGAVALVLVVLFIVAVVLILKNSKNASTTNAIIDALRSNLLVDQNKSNEEILAEVKADNEKYVAMFKELLEIVAEKKASKVAEKVNKLDEALGITSAQKVE